MNVVDGSYTKLSVADAQQLRANGIVAWGQCLWTGTEQPEPRIENLRNALAGGLLVFGYISVTGAHPGEWHVSCGYAGIPDDLWAQLQLVFVDVELPGIPTQTVRNAVEAVVVAGKSRAIYTSNHAWVDLMGNPTTFTDCMLWDANWDDHDALELVRHYGCWTPAQLIGKQFSGGTDMLSIYVDQSVFDTKLLEEGNMDPTMTPEALSRRLDLERAARLLTGAVDGDDMKTLVLLLAYMGVVSADTKVLKEHIGP